MKAKGILMNGAMVRAIMREVNPKTQTRRLIQHQEDVEVTDEGEFVHYHAHNCGGFFRRDRPSEARIPDQGFEGCL